MTEKMHLRTVTPNNYRRIINLKVAGNGCRKGPKAFYEKLGFKENGDKITHENGELEVVLVFPL